MAAVAEVEVQTGLLGAISERAKPENSVDGAWSADFQAKMAAALAEFGGDAFPLSGGDPDLPTPQHICDAAQKAIADGEHHYTDKAGIQPLRAAISAHILETDGLEYSDGQNAHVSRLRRSLSSATG
jgi:aspartate/methionine/tyrosine aminotransferase